MDTKFNVILLLFIPLIEHLLADDISVPSTELHSIEGKVYPPDSLPGSGNVGNWQIQTRILANGGEYLGFLR